MASAPDDRHQHLEELVCCNMHDQAPVVVVTVALFFVNLQQKEVEFLHNENQLLEGHLQRVSLS